ncbi:serine/threonine-protein kinase BSK1-like [Hordeum vulgare subsp. vulgare]|uniref:non-specific serine/threonine protein kinase n=1 Tax=Hordeum vulgare subsp. vulgare TaxID=112509 RepID=A0A8I7BAZ3_HORVV|nr:serine/threonine-protein kinase BSK1-like [Hordeum vulgare subsp. vulgare]
MGGKSSKYNSNLVQDNKMGGESSKYNSNLVQDNKMGGESSKYHSNLVQDNKMGGESSKYDSNLVQDNKMSGECSKHNDNDNLELMLWDQTSLPPKLSFQYLKMITNNFSDEHALGSGGSGVVYKGRMSNGEVIAVKKLQPSLPSVQRLFENEVYRLMYLNHPHIVRLRGYCYETQYVCVEHNGTLVFAEISERLLCLQYYPKGSLAGYISDESSGLKWDTRYNIIVGICYALKYLHEENDKPVLHMDLKPANILLDDAMRAKITDFGLARLLDPQQTIITSSRDGTLGYMAPEYLHGGKVTTKSDIFSLGAIILEVITGHKDYTSERFMELTLDRWRSRNPLNKSPGYIPKIRRCIEIGLACVNPERKGRPTTGELIKLLEGRLTLDEIAVSRMEVEPTYFPPDLTAIHEILEKERYKEDQEIASELSFQMWTEQTADMLTKRKRGDVAFRAGDFQVALDNFTEFIDTGTMISLVVYARRSLCYLMLNQLDAALQDLKKIEDIILKWNIKKWPTVLYMEEVVVSMLDSQMRRRATEMLNEESHLEEERRGKETFSFQTNDGFTFPKLSQ